LLSLSAVNALAVSDLAVCSR